MLSKNLIWSRLSESTQIHLFFDGLECKRFKDGDGGDGDGD